MGAEVTRSTGRNAAQHPIPTGAVPKHTLDLPWRHAAPPPRRPQVPGRCFSPRSAPALASPTRSSQVWLMGRRLLWLALKASPPDAATCFLPGTQILRPRIQGTLWHQTEDPANPRSARPRPWPAPQPRVPGTQSLRVLVPSSAEWGGEAPTAPGPARDRGVTVGTSPWTGP